ncbi:MAG: cytochrome c biogenesis protein CcsA [Aquificae bacterium]|nr:cytochrome c biogenesis protein CcsA [Aquificota bacterium]
MLFLLSSVILYVVSGVLFFLKVFLGINLKSLPTLSLLLSFILYALYFFQRYFSTGHFPVGDVYSMVSLMGNLLVVIFVVVNLGLKRNIGDFGLIVAFIGFLTTFLGLPAKEVGYKNPFYVYHILSAAVAYASLILAGASSLIKFAVEKKLKAKHIGGFMIPVNLLRKMERILLNLGFIFLTLTLIFGSLWAKDYLGRHWINDPKLILTLGLWLYYAVLVHLNLIKGLKPSQLSFLSMVGFVFVLASLAFIRHTVS